jgi:hypothetical protein
MEAKEKLLALLIKFDCRVFCHKNYSSNRHHMVAKLLILFCRTNHLNSDPKQSSINQLLVDFSQVIKLF